MTIKRALAQFMQDSGFGVYNTDLFLGSIPVERKLAAGWWILGGGGAPIIKNQTGEKAKAYILTVFYRDSDAEIVDQKLQSLEEKVNSKGCLDLDNYETIEMEATGFQSDSDIDLEDRTIGSVEVTITVYQSA